MARFELKASCAVHDIKFDKTTNYDLKKKPAILIGFWKKKMADGRQLIQWRI